MWFLTTVSPRWRQLEKMKTLLNTGTICVWKIQPTYRTIQTLTHQCIFKTIGSLQMNKHKNRGSCIDNSGFVPHFPLHTPLWQPCLPPEGPSTPAEDIGILEGTSAPIPPPKIPVPLGTDSTYTKHIPDSIAINPIASSPHSSPPVPAVRRSERTNKGQYNRTKYIDKVYLTMLDQTKHDNFYKKQLAYSAELLTCFDSCSQHY